MAPQDLNFLSLPVTLLAAFVVGPLLFRRAGYPWGKTVFGTISGLMIALAIWGVLFNLQKKAGIVTWPLGWLVPVVGTWIAWHFRARLSAFNPE